MREIIKKIERLEKRYNKNHTKALSPEDMLHVLKGRTDEEVEEEQKAIKAELKRRYSAQEIAASPPIVFVRFI